MSEGHNSTLNGSARERVRSFVRRALTLETDADQIKEDLKEVYTEAKGEGFDPSILRKVVARARKGAQKVAEEDALIATYEAAVQGDLFANDDTRVTIEFGDKKIETTARGMQAAADRMRS